MADYIVVPGRVNIYVACPFTYVRETATIAIGTPIKLGESADEIRIRHQILKNPVPGDRNGGRAGDPIEEQYLGETASVSLELSRFDKEVAGALRRAGGILTTPGAIPNNAIGALMRRDKSYRFTFVSTVDATRTVNFWCGIINQAHILSGGTKFEMFQSEISFHRTPEGHWSDPPGEPAGQYDNILYDAVTTGIV
jgi:hypothetical protein